MFKIDINIKVDPKAIDFTITSDQRLNLGQLQTVNDILSDVIRIAREYEGPPAGLPDEDEHRRPNETNFDMHPAAKCVHCGYTFEHHIGGGLDSPKARVPCLNWKENFRAE